MPALGFSRPSLDCSRIIRFVPALFLLFSAASWDGVLPSAQAASTDASRKFVQQLGDRTIEVLSNESYSDADRMDHYRALLQEGFAVDTIGRFALGRYWRAATAALREEYLFLFQEFVLDIYSKRLDGFSGKSFTIIKSKAIDETDTIVSTELSGEGSPPIRVDYRVREHDGKLLVVDIMVEGISLIVTQRSEFASIIHRDGLEGLLEKLRQYTKAN